MNAAAVRELALLQGLREQMARSRAAAAERSRATRELTANTTLQAVDGELARYAACRTARHLCVDRIGLAAQRVSLAVATAGEAHDLLHAAKAEQERARAGWQEAVTRQQVLEEAAADLHRRETRKAENRRDMAVIAQRNAGGMGTRS